MSGIYRRQQEAPAASDIAGMAFGDLWSQLAIIFMVATAVTLPILLYTVVSKSMENAQMRESLSNTVQGQFADLLQRDLQESQQRELEMAALRRENQELNQHLDEQQQRVNEYKQLFQQLQAEFDQQSRLLQRQNFIAGQRHLAVEGYRKEIQRGREHLNETKIRLVTRYHELVKHFLIFKAENKQLKEQLESMRQTIQQLESQTESTEETQ